MNESIYLTDRHIQQILWCGKWKKNAIEGESINYYKYDFRGKLKNPQSATVNHAGNISRVTAFFSSSSSSSQFTMLYLHTA